MSMDATTVNPVLGIGSREIWARWGRLRTRKAITEQLPRGPQVEDTVEISPAGIAISRADAQSSQQSARICDIRAEIKAETFLTPERMQETVESLLKVIG